MPEKTPGTSAINGPLWGSSAEDWAAIQEKTCEAVYRAAFDHAGLASGMQYLDAGCGAGLALQIAADRGASVTGLDASAELLAIARTRVPSADIRQGDLELLPYANGSFNLVTGFNSFQYAANPVAALTEAKRVAKPGAMVIVMTWGEPAGMEAATLVAALKPLLPPTPPNAPGPFALSNKDALTAFSTSAGLQPKDVFDVDSPWIYANLQTAMRGLGSSGVAAKAVKQSGKESVDAAHAAALAPFVQSDGSYRIGANFRCLVATA